MIWLWVVAAGSIGLGVGFVFGSSAGYKSATDKVCRALQQMPQMQEKGEAEGDE